MLYCSGTTGRPKGVEVPLPNAPLGTKTVGGDGGRDAPRLRRADGVPEPGAAVPRRPAALHHGRAPRRRHRGRHGALRPGRGAAAHPGAPRSPTRQWVPTMFIRMLKLPDDVRTSLDVSSMQMMFHAAAPCPVEVKRRMIDWFGPGHPRVLRRHRGQRLRLLQQRGVARPPRHGRAEPARVAPHRRRGRQRAAAPASRAPIWFEGEPDLRVPQRPGEDGRLPPPEGLDHPRRRRLPRRGRLPVTSPTARRT